MSNALDNETCVLYGERIKHYRNSLLNEIAFFDRGIVTPKLMRALSDIFQTLKDTPHVTPDRIPLSGQVIIDTFRPRLPATEDLWNSSSLYSRAHWFFKHTGLFTIVCNPMKAKIAHWTIPVPLRLKNACNIYTVHDLVPLRLPYTTLDDKRLFYKLMGSVVAKADLLLTVSEHSRRDIVSMFDKADDKVLNVYQPVSIPTHLLNSSQDYVAESIRGLHGLEYKKYILFYGAIEPKKNVGRLIEAYLTSGLEIPLVIAGKDGWLIEDELRQISLPSIRYLHTDGHVTREKQRIIRIGYSSFEQLVNLIRGATLIAFPSLYEGFGLPIVEGMICSTPVLTGNIGATKEIAGDAALMVDPYSIRDIREGLLALSRRDVADEWQAKGLLRAKDFAPERIKQSVRDAYEFALGQAKKLSLSNTM